MNYSMLFVMDLSRYFNSIFFDIVTSEKSVCKFYNHVRRTSRIFSANVINCFFWNFVIMSTLSKHA